MSDAKEVNIEVPAGLVVGATTVVEADGRFEKSYAESVAKSQTGRGTDRFTEDHGKVKSREINIQV